MPDYLESLENPWFRCGALREVLNIAIQKLERDPPKIAIKNTIAYLREVANQCDQADAARQARTS